MSENDTSSYREERGEGAGGPDPRERMGDLSLGSTPRGIVGGEGTPRDEADGDVTAGDDRTAAEARGGADAMREARQLQEREKLG